LGSPLPVRPHRSQSDWPFRLSFIHPCSRTRLPERSSHGVSPSFTACQRASVNGLSTDDTSLGVLVPFSASGKGRLRPSRLAPIRLPEVLASGPADGSHPADYGAAHRFSQPLSDLFLPPPSRHLSDGLRSWGSLFRGFVSPSVAAPARHRRLALVAVLPADWPLLPPRMGSLREALPPSPRMPDEEPLFAFRASSHTGIGPHRQHTINALTTDLPLLSFHLPMA
jgi:hypothetical protein